jgi:Ca2+-binding EF-hand superfamily protein
MVGSVSGGAGGFDISSLTQRQQQRFTSIDKNGDGKIDKSEMSAFQQAQKAQGKQGGPSTDRIFSKLDADSDGAITMQEAAAGLAKIAQRMQEQASAGASQTPQAGQAETVSTGAGTGLEDVLAAALRSYGQWATGSAAQKTGYTAAPV